MDLNHFAIFHAVAVAGCALRLAEEAGKSRRSPAARANDA
jgi:hypothetical protein